MATITRVRGRGQAATLKPALDALISAGMPVSVSDGGSSPSFLAWMKRRPGLTIAPPGDSLVAQARASLAAARDPRRPFILYTEPDKREFFERGLAGFIARASASATVGIHLAARTAAAMDTFPRFQRLAETGASRMCARLVGPAADYFYGPLLIRRELVPLVSRASRDLGWGWRPFMFVIVSQLGYQVVPISGHYACPADQRAEGEDDKEYRLHQFADNVRGLLEGHASLCRMSSRPDRISIQ